MTHDTYDTFRVILPLLTRATREVSKIICNFADDLEIFGEIFDKTIKKDNENKMPLRAAADAGRQVERDAAAVADERHGDERRPELHAL